MNINFSIEQFLDLSNYVNLTRANRRKGKGGTQEFFTPFSIIQRMGNKIDDETWSDSSKTFLESSFENGQYDVKDFLKLMETNKEEVLKMLMVLIGRKYLMKLKIIH